VRDAVESAQEAKRRETALLEEKSALEVEGRQKDNLVDLLREQFAALRQENEQNLVTVGSLRKQLEQVPTTHEFSFRGLRWRATWRLTF
jgi:hypothetical protein